MLLPPPAHLLCLELAPFRKGRLGPLSEFLAVTATTNTRP
jgi:hypothetical protein